MVSDGYKQVSMEYDTEYEKHNETGNFGELEQSNQYNTKEVSEFTTPLDGEALTKEIGGTALVQELYDKDKGAGFKEMRDLQDLLSSIKGAAVFMNHTPKEQL